MRLPPKKRLQLIKDELPKGTSKGTIAQLCGVRQETISRDIRKWKKSGGFYNWLEEEFFKLHSSVKENEPTKAYQVIARLLEKTLIRKVETQITGEQELKIVVVDEVRNA